MNGVVRLKAYTLRHGYNNKRKIVCAGKKKRFYGPQSTRSDRHQSRAQVYRRNEEKYPLYANNAPNLQRATRPIQ